jgi:hypothetical protein
VQVFGKSAHPKLDPTAARDLHGEVAGAPKVAEASMPILEALVCETHAAALLAANIASAVNAFRRPDTERSERELRPYVPSEPALISVLRSRMLEADLDPDTVAVIVGFFDDLGPARVALNQYFSDANKLGDERASALHLLTLSNAWQRASATTPSSPPASCTAT